LIVFQDQDVFPIFSLILFHIPLALRAIHRTAVHPVFALISFDVAASVMAEPNNQVR
jgi:hypothetical protein